jgi:PRTRC genetic system protein D
MTANAKTKDLLMPNAGIDLGYFQVKIASSKETSGSGIESRKDHFPSFAPTVYLDSLAHLPRGLNNYKGVVIKINGLSHYVGEDSIRAFDSAGHTRAFNERYCLTPIYKALLLGALWRIAKSHGVKGCLTIRHLVLGLPFTTLVEHHNFVQEMAKGEHEIPSPFCASETINVVIEEAMVVAQPQGGGVSWANREGRNLIKPNDEILILDLGGGTFNWFSCNGRYQPNYKECGSLPIGTLNCSSTVLRCIKPRLVNSPEAMSRVDQALHNGGGSFELAGKSYFTSDFSNEINSLVRSAIYQMQSLVGELGVFQHILLTGGGAGLLKRICDGEFKNSHKRIRMVSDPVFANVDGFYIISQAMKA